MLLIAKFLNSASPLGSIIKRKRAAEKRNPINLTDADIDRIVAEIGPERVLAALDRTTAPAVVAE